MNKVDCVSFSINKYSDINIVLENCVIVYMNIVNANIIVYVSNDVELTHGDIEEFDNIGVHVFKSNNPMLKQFTIMRNDEHHNRYIIHTLPVPIDMFSVQRWMSSNDNYLLISNSKSFTFGGYCVDSEEFYNWYESFDGNNYVDYFNNHIINHIQNNFMLVTSPHNALSYSLWGDTPLYIEGMKYNLKLIKKFYPNWECRIYIDSSISYDVIDELLELGATIYFRQDTNGSSGMLWRFEIMFDVNVDYFAIRDADSRITYREVLAVGEWTRSGTSFHVMRDNPGHGTPILGGMWGGRTSSCAKYEDVFVNEVFSSHKGYDQEFLTKHLWKDVKNDMVCHRSSVFRYFVTPFDRDFPIPLELNHYVGAVVPAEESGEDWYAEYQ